MTEFSEIIAEWKKAKTIKYVRWNTCNDELVCDVCRERNGKKFLLSEIENLIPAHKGCRCWIVPIVDIEAFGDSLDFIFEDDESL